MTRTQEFIEKNKKVLTSEGLQGGTPGTGSSLVAWGDEDADAEILSNTNLPGILVKYIKSL